MSSKKLTILIRSYPLSRKLNPDSNLSFERFNSLVHPIANGKKAPCPCGLGRKFKHCCIQSSRFDGSRRNNYSRE
ncbi:SEC-C metal-binding domain-containing protein [Acaryochloris marina NIES-2412]|uniref:SEC-C metal-binding domain-containing protein n=1 Tax=Acaryochloris marina TaxID=155978 RepID=UPI004059F008